MIDNPATKDLMRACMFIGDVYQPDTTQASVKHHLPKALKALAEGANPNVTLENGQFLLWRMCRAGQVQLVKALLDHGADPNTVQDPGTSNEECVLEQTVRLLGRAFSDECHPPLFDDELINIRYADDEDDGPPLPASVVHQQILAHLFDAGAKPPTKPNLISVLCNRGQFAGKMIIPAVDFLIRAGVDPRPAQEYLRTSNNPPNPQLRCPALWDHIQHISAQQNAADLIFDAELDTIQSPQSRRRTL